MEKAEEKISTENDAVNITIRIFQLSFKIALTHVGRPKLE